MLFNSVQYLLFLPVVVAVYWLLKKNLRLLFLLGASYYFYMSWFPPYCLLLAGLTVCNYFLGLAISNVPNQPARRKVLFLIGLVLNLGCLAFFKYANFLLDLISPLLKQVTPLSPPGASGAALHLNILLPLAISFFVFEFVHYLGDIYTGNAPIKNPIRFALFAAFFPSQIAGPIKRYEQFDAQFSGDRKFSPALFQRGISLILQGLFKKVALGDNLVPIVDKGFSSIQYLAPCDAWVAALAFTFQIYYDFSGYTDIGRGSAMLLGISLPENFNKPYLATSLIDFWRRWHMTLSSWLRDYLYKPLGGSRGGSLLKNRNLLVTMLLGGLWHGASWHFVVWGAFHGIGLIINHGWQKLFDKKNTVSNLVGGFCTFLFVLMGWVLFRADTFENACAMYQHMFMVTGATMQPGFLWTAFYTSTLPAVFFVYGLLLVLQQISGASEITGDETAEPKSLSESNGNSAWLNSYGVRILKPSVAMRAASYAGFALIILCLASKRAAPFIYFQF